jgi:hypothetical protein
VEEEQRQPAGQLGRASDSQIEAVCRARSLQAAPRVPASPPGWGPRPCCLRMAGGMASCRSPT